MIGFPPQPIGYRWVVVFDDFEASPHIRASRTFLAEHEARELWDKLGRSFDVKRIALYKIPVFDRSVKRSA